MNPQQKARTGAAIAGLCIVYIWLIHLPSRIDQVRRDLEPRIVAVEKQSQGRPRDEVLKAAQLDLANKLNELKDKVTELDSNTRAAPLSGSIADVEELRRDISDLRRELQNTEADLRAEMRRQAHAMPSSDLAEAAEAPTGTDSVASSGAQGVTVPPRAASPRISPRVTTTVGDWRFEANGATVEEGRIRISVTITILGKDGLFEFFPYDTRCYDQAGREFATSKATIGAQEYANLGRSSIKRKFIADLPTEVVFEFEGATSDAREVTALDISFVKDQSKSYEWYLAKLRGIPRLQ